LRKHDEIANALRLVIESAYVRIPGNPGPGSPSKHGNVVRFKTMAAKRLRGEPIRSPGFVKRGNRKK
jgi:hypothetical protein